MSTVPACLTFYFHHRSTKLLHLPMSIVTWLTWKYFWICFSFIEWTLFDLRCAYIYVYVTTLKYGLNAAVSALPTGDRQVWSWTVEPHTPQQFQCMTVMSFSKVSKTHLFIIYYWRWDESTSIVGCCWLFNSFLTSFFDGKTSFKRLLTISSYHLNLYTSLLFLFVKSSIF